MLGWLKRWFATMARRRQRGLFTFFDGRQFVSADPWPIYRQIYNDSEFVIGQGQDDPADMLQDALNLEEPAFSKAVACVHRAFGTQPYDRKTGRGLTETEAFALLTEFIEWCADLVKKNAGSPNSLPPTESGSSTGQECPDEPTKQPLSSHSSPAQSEPCAATSSSME